MANNVVVNYAAKVADFITDTKRAAAEHKKAMKEMGDSAKEMAETLKTAFEVLGVAEIARDVINVTRESEASMAQLKAVVLSTGGAIGVGVGQLKDWAEGLSQSTAYSHVAVESAEALLLTFTQIGKTVFPEAIKATTDMATALHEDLSEAARTVGKALENPEKGLTALRKAGVLFTADQAKTIKTLEDTGHMAEAQRIILKQLEVQFGGSAAAARNTLGGALDSLHNAFDDLLEGKGGVNDASKEINELTKLLGSDETKANFASMTTDIIELLGYVAKATNAFVGLSNAITDAFRGPADKSFMGMLAARDEIAGALKTAQSVQGQLTDQTLIPNLKKQLAEYDQLIAEHNHHREPVRIIMPGDSIDPSVLKPLKPPPPGTGTGTARKRADPYDALNTYLQTLGRKTFDSGDPALDAYNRGLDELNEKIAAFTKNGGDAAKAAAAFARGDGDLLKKYAEDEAKEARQRQDDTDQFIGSLKEQLAARKADLDMQALAVGMGAKELGQIQAITQVQAEGAKTIAELTREQNAARTQADKDAYQDRIDAEKKFVADQLQIMKAGDAKLAAEQADWHNGARRALQDFQDQAKDIAGQVHDAFASALEGLTDSITNFITTGKGGLKALGQQIEQSIVHMFVQSDLAKLTAPDGPLGGLLSKIGLGGADYGQSAQIAAETANTSALIGLTAALESQAAMSSAAGFGGSTSLGSLFSSLFGGSAGASFGAAVDLGDAASFGTLPGFADGGDVAANNPIWVGERGPEIFVPNTAGAIVPNHKTAAVANGNGKGGDVHVHHHYHAASPDRSTKTQMEIRTYDAVKRAQRNR